MARFDYPSPYWDRVGDPALDLIDRMLTVDVEKRATIDECLEHPWTTQQTVSVTDSTDGLTGALAGLDFSKRKPHRERTLLSSINDIKIERVIETQTQAGAEAVKVFDKNAGGGAKHFVTNSQQPAGGKKKDAGHTEKTIQPTPDSGRDPMEFVAMGGKGDELLFDGAGDVEEGESRYAGAGETTIKAGNPGA